jgi:uncharacterized protein (DUF433 family)
MATATIDINRLLESRPDVLGGQVVVRGTRVTVQSIVGMHLDGYSPEDIALDCDGVTLADVHAALAYYYTHKDELDGQHRAEQAAAEAAAREVGIELR